MSDCRSCSGRLFHSIGLAVAKQRSPNWLCDLLTKHVQLSADRRGWRPAAVTSIHSSARYTGAVPANERQTRVDILKSTCLRTGCQCSTNTVQVLIYSFASAQMALNTWQKQIKLCSTEHKPAGCLFYFSSHYKGQTSPRSNNI